MFLSQIAQALQAEPPDDSQDEEPTSSQGEGGPERNEEEDAAEDDSRPEGSQLSFWGVATALTATVKAKTAKVLSTVQDVDWREELEAFQLGAKEDAEAVGKGADVVMHRAKEAAEQLPATLEHLPGNAALLQARAEAAGAVAREQTKRGLAGLAGLGSKLVLSTHDLLEQINHAVQHEMALTDGSSAASRHASSSKLGAGQGGRYSRFEADVAAMQRDSSTYCDEPEDCDEFETWLASFDLAARKPDVDRLIAENTFMSELQARIVPLIVEYESFWTRYFYRLHKLELKHHQFQQLAQRVQNSEEEVGWSSDEEVEQPLKGGSGQPAVGQTAAAASGGAALAASLPSTVAPKDEQKSEDAGALEAPHHPSTSVALQSDAGALEEPSSEAGSSPAGSAGGTGAHTESQQPQQAHQRSASAAPSDETATLSSDSEHWQVVGSPRQGQRPTSAGDEQRERPAAVVEGADEPAGTAVSAATTEASESAALAATSAAPTVASSAGGSEADDVDASPSLPAAAAPAERVPAAQEEDSVVAAAGDDELSDWGDDDEAALASAAVAAGAEGKAGADDDEAWGSDWE